MNGAELAQLRRAVNRDSLDTDSLAGHLEARVARLEEVVATRWPDRILAWARLGRELRASTRNFPGYCHSNSTAEGPLNRNNERWSHPRCNSRTGLVYPG